MWFPDAARSPISRCCRRSRAEATPGVPPGPPYSPLYTQSRLMGQFNGVQPGFKLQFSQSSAGRRHGGGRGRSAGGQRTESHRGRTRRTRETENTHRDPERSVSTEPVWRLSVSPWQRRAAVLAVSHNRLLERTGRKKRSISADRKFAASSFLSHTPSD